jgi:hypothetical protein
MKDKEKYINIQKQLIEKLVDLDKLPEEVRNNLTDYVTFRHELTIESDRGCALLAGSYLDSQLEKVLRKKMVGNKKHLDNLFDFNGPLGTFSGRITITYSLGLISKNDLNDLQLVRKIRNTFGHSPSIIDFENEKIKSYCNNLKLVVRERSKSPRQKFNSSVSYLLGAIEGMLYTEDDTFIEKPNSELENFKKTIDEFDGVVEKLFERTEEE